MSERSSMHKLKSGALAALLAAGLVITGMPMAAHAAGYAPLSVSGTVTNPDSAYGPTVQIETSEVECASTGDVDATDGTYNLSIYPVPDGPLCDTELTYTAALYGDPEVTTGSAPYGYATSYWTGVGAQSSPYWQDAGPLPFSKDDRALDDINFTLLPNGQITGTVDLPEGIATTNYVVAGEPGFDPQDGSTWLRDSRLESDDGSYEMLLPAGDFVLALVTETDSGNLTLGYYNSESTVYSVDEATAVSVTAAEETPNIDFAPVAAEKLRVSGSVVDPDPSVFGKIVVRSDSPDYCSSIGYRESDNTYSLELDDPNCTFEDKYRASYEMGSSATSTLAPFGYAPSYWAGEGEPSTPNYDQAEMLPFTESVLHLDGIDFTLNPFGQIAGSVHSSLLETTEMMVSVVAGAPGFDARNNSEWLGTTWLYADDGYELRIGDGNYAVALIAETDVWNDDLGRFEFNVLGYYSENGVVESAGDAATVTVTAAKQVSSIDFVTATPPDVPTVTAGTVKITGAAEVGKTLTAVTSGWKPAGVDLSYQWNRGGEVILGANASTYVLTSEDTGSPITVTVTGTKTGFVTAEKESNSTTAVVDLTAPGSISVTVLDSGEAPLEGAWVTATNKAGVIFASGRTNSNGELVLPDLPRQAYTVAAWTGNGVGHDSKNVTIADPGENVGVVLTVVEPSFPTGIVVEGSIPSWNAMAVNPSDAHQITVAEAPGATGTFSVVPGDLSFALTETPAGSGNYVGTIPADVTTAGPDGTIAITVNLAWPGGATYTESFELLYIDPSGHVVDRYGTPAGGSTVTLMRSDTQAGSYVQVANGDASVMDPAVNAVNPTVTDAEGFFRWDVTPGWYQVRADFSGANITTNPMAVPPERLNLLIAVPTGTAPQAIEAPVLNGDANVGEKLTVTGGAWPVVAGERAPIEVLGYQWMRDGVAISDATQSAYTVTGADAGKDITVQLTIGRQLTADAGSVDTWTITLEAGEGEELASTGDNTSIVGLGLSAAALMMLGVAVFGADFMRRRGGRKELLKN